MAVVYWIHLEEHTDIFSQGYVGVTSVGVEKRFSQHKSTSKTGKLPISLALRKYGNRVVISTVLIADTEYCYFVEEMLRPSTRIGWNCASGGDSTLKGFKHSEETKKRLSEMQKGKKLSEDHKKKLAAVSKGRRHSEHTKQLLREKAKLRTIPQHVLDALFEGARGRRPWQNPNSNSLVWESAVKFYTLFRENEDEFLHVIASKLGFKRSQFLVMHRLVKQGWNPLEDAQWLETFNKGNKYGSCSY